MWCDVNIIPINPMNIVHQFISKLEFKWIIHPWKCPLLDRIYLKSSNSPQKNANNNVPNPQISHPFTSPSPNGNSSPQNTTSGTSGTRPAWCAPSTKRPGNASRRPGSAWRRTSPGDPVDPFRRCGGGRGDLRSRRKTRKNGGFIMSYPWWMDI